MKFRIIAGLVVVTCLTSFANAQVTYGGNVSPSNPAGWTTSTGGLVGTGGYGWVKIDSGGTVRNQWAAVGYRSGNSGDMTVTGPGATWITGNDMYVGLWGNGYLEISNGGVVHSPLPRIAFYTNSTGRAVVDGAGSLWVAAGYSYVGGGGTGSLDIVNGGRVETQGTIIGGIWWDNNQGGGAGTGTVNVAGEGSVLETDDLLVGFLGDGSLNIEDGGMVSCSSQMRIRHEDGKSGAVNMASGGMLAIHGEGANSLSEFFSLIGGTDNGNIHYWKDSLSDWAPITDAVRGEDYALTYLAEGDLVGYTMLTVGGEVPEPATMSLLTLGGLTLLRRRTR